MRKIQSYCVTWTAYFHGNHPEDAAKEALELQRNPNSNAVLFEVKDEEGNKFLVNLDGKSPLMMLDKDGNQVESLPKYLSDDDDDLPDETDFNRDIFEEALSHEICRITDGNSPGISALVNHPVIAAFGTSPKHSEQQLAGLAVLHREKKDQTPKAVTLKDLTEAVPIGQSRWQLLDGRELQFCVKWR